MNKLNPKIVSLIKEGFKYETLKSLNNQQINALFKRIVSEVTMVSKSDTNTINTLKSEKKPFEVYEDDTLDDKDALGTYAMQQDTGQQMPHDADDMAPDGMDDDSDNNRKMMTDGEIREKFKSKAQQGYFFAKCEEEGPKSKWCKMADEFASKTKNWNKLPEKVKTESFEQKVDIIESSLLNLIHKHLPPQMSKKDFLELVEADTKEIPTKTPTKTPSKPERKTPYQPKHKPAPKAELPKELKFGSLKIKFKDEKKD